MEIIYSKKYIYPKKICNCDKKYLVKKFYFNKKPKGETNFNISQKFYFRFFNFCKKCSHCYSVSKVNLEKIYKKFYSKKTYGKKKDIIKKFNRIISLPKKNSDNFYRVNRVKQFLKKKNIKKYNFLDIGSGLGVFPYTLMQNGYKCLALEPDINCCKHMKGLNLEVINNFFLKQKFNKKQFNFIFMNKVLEHIRNPITMLRKVYKILNRKGFLYIELPDINSLKSKNGIMSEEFFIEHYHVFSKISLKHMLENCKFKIIKLKNIIEKSGKYTIICFATK